MSENVSFPSNGNSADGYLALPASGSGPGVIVVQEWWGLNTQIKGVVDRLASEGFVALAPDLYHGELCGHDEMDKASHLMTTLDQQLATRDMGGAVDYLLGRDEVTGDAVGVIGFCMGGMLAFLLAAAYGDKIAAVTPWYGAPVFGNAPDWATMTAAVRGHFAENDDFFGPDKIAPLEEELRGLGKDVTLIVHPGTGHAFGNEENALGTYDQAVTAECWADSISFLKSHLSS
jgi:carboxymethylenebutenolidase